MSKNSLNRTLSAFACATATVIISVDFSLGSKLARADVLDLSCTGGYTATYNPGLTLEEKQAIVKIDSTLSTCVPLLTDPTIKSGSYSNTLNVTASCDLTNSTPYDIEYHWSNERHSIVHFASTINQKPGGETVLVSTGIVTDGEFKNDMATRILALATFDTAECLTNGVPNATGDETLVLTGQ
ncbi:MAG: hypothetical protein PUP91_29260 [Rhizonema sp. PD37]|nr:hypothetical protein [Rhizonema sp. PD37]